MSDLQSTIAKKRQNSDSTFKVSPFQSLGFGVQAKSEESVPATKAELWNSYQQAKHLNQKGANPAPILPIQAKLTVGKAGDKYEQEADNMAAQVMAMPASGQVQREELSEEDEELQMKPLPGTISPLLQRDALPEEEDEIQAKPLATTISPIVQREALPEEEELQMKPCDNVIQRELSPDEDDEPELQMKPLGNLIQRETLPEVEEEIQTKQLPDPNSQVPTSSLENRLSSSKGGGNPLSENVRSFMEPRFGADFSGVRVHTGSDAVQMNQSVNAQAFAHGQDIYFGAGKSPGNNDLTAHELTHTIQQTGGLQKRSLGKFRKHNKIQAKLDSTSPIVQCKENTPQQSEQNQPSPQQTDSAPTNSGVEQQSAPLQGVSPVAGGEGKQATPQDSTPTNSGQPTGTSPVANVSQSSATADGGSQPASGGTDLTLDGGKQADTGGSSATSAENDPGFKAVTERTKHSAKAQKEHPPAGVKSAEAQAAAIAPSNEVEAKAQDRQVQEMNQQQPGQFNAAKFKAALMEKIESKVPKNLEEVNNFKNQNQLDGVRGDVSTQVKSEQQQAAGGVEEKTKEQPNTAGIPPKLVTPIPPAQPEAKPPDVGAADAAPKPKTASEVSLQEDSQALDKQMTNADVSEEQLASSNEPEFQTALGSKQSTQTHANTAPVAYRQQEGVIVTQAQATAQTTAQNQLQGMHGDKNKVLSTVFGQQGQAKGQDEAKRTEVASHIQNIYGKTKQEVTKILGELDSQVTPLFDQGAATAKSIFENHVDQEMTRYKDERYSGLRGKKRWLTDKLHLTTLPDAVNKFYEAGKKLYLDSIGKTIDRIAALVSSKLNAATAEIAKGKQEIQQYVAKLDPSLKEVGKEAAQNIQSKFDELTESIDNKQNELIDSLAQKYQENLQGINARIDEMKQANRSLFDMAKDAIGGAIETILELKNMLMSTLAKAGSAISKIIKDPIGFLGNLVAGVKQGFMNFAGNIFEHLKKGLLGWLTGALGGTGIQLPENFDMKGIFSLVMQVLGMTYQNIRGKAADKLGEKAVNKLEASFEWFIILKEQGLAGLWEHIQEKIGDLKTMVLDNIQNFVIESIVKAGVTWVLSLLNPASAFIKACKAIYDIVMFFIERGSQIMELVNAVIDSVTAIANGSIGSAATFIENALSKALPVVISFMASLLGLGGISEKIQSIVKTVQTPINKAIDWVIGKAMKFAKKFKNSKFGKKIDAGKKWVKDKKDAATKWVKDKKDKLGQQFNNNKDNKQDYLKNKTTLKSLVEPNSVKIQHVDPDLAKEIAQTNSGTVLYQKGGEPQQVTQNILELHNDAKFDKDSGTLTLPSLKEQPLKQATSLHQAANKVVELTGVSKITLVKNVEGARLDGSINPTVYGLVNYIVPTTANSLDPLIKDIEKSANIQHPDKDYLISICKEAANRYGAKVDWTETKRPPRRLEIIFEHLTSNEKFQTEINQIYSDNICPSCVISTGERKPHNVISASVFRNTIEMVLRNYGVTTFDVWSDRIISFGNSTSSTAVTEAKQCEPCETAQGPWTLQQRVEGKAPVGNQFSHATSAQVEQLTKDKIQQVTNEISKYLGSSVGTKDRQSTSDINTKIVMPNKINDFINDLTIELEKAAK